MLSALMFVLCFAYATLRYVVLGPVPSSELPLLIANKALSLSLLCWLLQLQLRMAQGREAPAWLPGLLRRGAEAHVVSSLALLALGSYGFVSQAQGISARAGAMMAAGIAALMLLVHDGKWSRSRTWSFYLLLLTHLILRGGSGWLRPSGWHGGMPPISMLAAALCLAVMILALRIEAASKR